MLESSLANLAAWSVQAAALVVAGAWLPTRLRLGLPRARLVLFRVLLVGCVGLPLLQPWHPVSPPSQEDSMPTSGTPGVLTKPDTTAATGCPTADCSAAPRSSEVTEPNAWAWMKATRALWNTSGPTQASTIFTTAAPLS